MGEGTERPMGERRRRREAERAAQASGSAQPLTRRELRRQEAEEAARLEAIATGELPVTDPAATAPSPSTAPSSTPSPSTASPSTPSPSTPSPSTASSSTPPPSRRSLRERATPAEEPPAQRTATGRRPVVRTPSTAQGVRSLDATGELTGIQPVVRPDDAEPSPQPPPAGAPSDRPAEAARAALPPRQASGAEPRREPDEPDGFSMQPRWVALSGGSAASPDDAPPPARRSVRSRISEPDDDPAPEPSPPAVTAIKIAILVVVAAVIGALIWLLASEAFDGSAGAQPTTVTTTPLIEESSAR